MDLQEILKNQYLVDRAEKMKNSEQLTLGELILLLEPIVERQEEYFKEHKYYTIVRFDFCDSVPDGIDSWRGIYAELAIGHKQCNPPNVVDFFKMLREAVGKTFIGYKGGDFIMGKTTPLWVDNNGDANNTAIVGIINKEYEVILNTKYNESY